MSELFENPPVFIIGAGSVGCYLAAKLSKTSKVTLVIRNEEHLLHYKNGLTLVGQESGEYFPNVSSWNQIQKFPENSILLITTKIYNFKEVFQNLIPRLQEGCQIGLCQNGLSVIEEAQKFAPEVKSNQWFRVLCWLGVRIRDLSWVEVAGVDRFELMSSNEKSIVQVFNDAEIPCSWKEISPSSLKISEWKKAILNIGTNGLAAFLGCKNKVLLEDFYLKKFLDQLIQEALQVARLEGVCFSDTEIQGIYTSLVKVGENENSTLQDLKRGRKTELPWFNGPVVSLAAKHRVSVPLNQCMMGLVKE